MTSKPLLTLQCSALTALADAAGLLLHPLLTLASDPPTSPHGVQIPPTRRLQLDLLRIMQDAVAMLCPLCSSVSEQALEARRTLTTPAEASAQRSELASFAAHVLTALQDSSGLFSSLATGAAERAQETGKVERFLSKLRIDYARQVLDNEQKTLVKRRAVKASEERVAELDGLVADARHDERREKRQLLLTRCVSVLGLRWGENDVCEAEKATRRATGIVDAAIQDRLRALKQRATYVGEYLKVATVTRQMQVELLRVDSCGAHTVERYGALRCLEARLREIVSIWECMMSSCSLLVNQADDSDVDEGSSHAEQWHTLSVALRLLHVSMSETAREMRSCLAQ